MKDESKTGGAEGLPGSSFILPPSSLQPKVTDFGLARVLDATSGRTRTGDIVGTLGYMAPEQAAGAAHRAGPPADVYALGAILYELLTGRVPFGPEPSARALYEVLHEPPSPPRRLARGIPRDLETVCLKCLEKNPDRRYPSALALAEDLRRFLDGRPVEARPVGAVAQVTRWAVRRPSAALLALVCAVATVGLVAGTLYHNTRLRGALATAEEQEAETARANHDLQAALGTAERLRAETRRQRDAAERQLDAARRALYALQLAQLPALWSKEPLRARTLLTDPQLCPPELHDFTWRYFSARCGLNEREFAAHTGGTRAIAFLKDGTLVSGGGDGRLRYWNPRAAPKSRGGRAVRAHDGPVVGVATPGGRVVTAGADGRVKVWDADAPEPVLVIHSPSAPAGVAASPDGTRLAGPCADGVVRVWETATGRQVAGLRGHDGPVLAAAFTADGRGLITGGRDRTVRVWDLDGTSPPVALAGHEGAVLGLAASPDGTVAVSTGDQGDVRLWNLKTGSPRDLRGHLMPVRGAAFSPNGDRFATGGADTYLKVWGAADGRELTNLMRSRVQTVAFSPDDAWVAGGTEDGKILVYRLPVVPTPARHPHRANVAAVAARPDGGVVTADAAGGVRVWDADGDDPVAEFSVPRPDRGPDRPHAITSGSGPVVAVSPGGETLAVGGGTGTLVLWDLHRQSEAARLAGHQGNVLAVAFDAGGTRLATGGEDGTVRVWDPSGREPPVVLTGHTGGVPAVAFSPDGRWIASGGEDHRVRLWDARTGMPGRVFQGHKMWVLAVAFSPDGKRLASGSRDRTTHVWDVEGDDPPQVIAGYTNWVSSVTFSPDGRTLATASGHAGIDTPGEVKLCDPAAGYVRAILSDVRAPVAFDRDGRRLFAGVSDGLAELVGR